MLDKEEVRRVSKGIEMEMREIHTGKTKTLTLAKLKKRYMK